MTPFPLPTTEHLVCQPVASVFERLQFCSEGADGCRWNRRRSSRHAFVWSVSCYEANMARRIKHFDSTPNTISSLRGRSDIRKRQRAVGWQADRQRFDNFDITHWIDYVRGVATDPDKESMKRHLAEGCDSCAHLITLVSRIWKTGAGERTVPEALVESAKAIFQERRSFAGGRSRSPRHRDRKV